jgi:predicted metal-dependent HD superfamily phosphohydrolase
MKITRATAERFGTLWRRCVASPPSPDAAAVYADLRDRLGGRGRAFHNLGHIDDCLRRFDEVAPRLADRDAVEVALWFHDAVYEPGNAENERRSAQLFLDQSVGALPQFRRRVCALILTTQRARAPRTNDCKFIDDIDLAGFGASWEDFMRNGERLRREFASLSDSDYYRGLSSFLAALRRRPQFFRTDYFVERYEKQARDNLDRLLALIAKNGYAATR